MRLCTRWRGMPPTLPRRSPARWAASCPSQACRHVAASSGGAGTAVSGHWKGAVNSTCLLAHVTGAYPLAALLIVRLQCCQLRPSGATAASACSFLEGQTMPQAASPSWPALSQTGGRTLTQACLNLSRLRAAMCAVQHRLSRSVPSRDLLSASTLLHQRNVLFCTAGSFAHISPAWASATSSLC